MCIQFVFNMFDVLACIQMSIYIVQLVSLLLENFSFRIVYDFVARACPALISSILIDLLFLLYLSPLTHTFTICSPSLPPPSLSLYWVHMITCHACATSPTIHRYNVGHGHLGWTRGAGSAKLLASMMSIAQDDQDDQDDQQMGKQQPQQPRRRRQPEMLHDIDPTPFSPARFS